MNECWTLSDASSTSIGYNHVSFLPYPLDVVAYINRFLIAEPTLPTWDKFHLVMVYNSVHAWFNSIC